MQTIQENQLQIVNIGTDGYVRVVGTDGKSYRVAIQTFMQGAGGGGGTSIPTSVRTALYTLLSSGAYATTGLTDELAVIESWAEEVSAITISQSSISISGAGTYQLTATTTPSGGSITWASSDGTIATVNSSGLVTAVGNGTATITAACGGLTATCTVTVSGVVSVVSIDATYTQSGTVYDTASLSDLVADLVVVANYDDSSTVTLTSDQYALSGTLTVGTSTVTVTYGSFTDTFSVTVTEYVIPSVTISWSGSGSTLTTGTTLIDATENDIYFKVPYVEGASQLASGITATDSAFKIMAGLFTSASSTSPVGYYHIDNGNVETSARSAVNCPALTFDTKVLFAPRGYYVKMVVYNNTSSFTSNSACRTYLNENATEITLE